MLSRGSSLPDVVERAAEDVVDAVHEVHRHLGNNLLERCYATALAHELRERGHRVEREVVLTLTYKNIDIGQAYRLDLLVDGMIVVECKTVSELRPEHYSQVATYLRLSGCALGFLVNFHAAPFRTGVKRIIAT